MTQDSFKSFSSALLLLFNPLWMDKEPCVFLKLYSSTQFSYHYIHQYTHICVSVCTLFRDCVWTCFSVMDFIEELFLLLLSHFTTVLLYCCYCIIDFYVLIMTCQGKLKMLLSFQIILRIKIHIHQRQLWCYLVLIHNRHCFNFFLCWWEDFKISHVPLSYSFFHSWHYFTPTKWQIASKKRRKTHIIRPVVQ